MMLVDLVSVRADDRCLLAGAYRAAAGEAPTLADACVLIHIPQVIAALAG